MQFLFKKNEIIITDTIKDQNQFKVLENIAKKYWI